MNTAYVDPAWKARYKQSQLENPTPRKHKEEDIEKRLARMRSKSILFRERT